MHRKRGILKVAIGDVVLDQLADAVMGNQEIAPPHESGEALPGDREDIMTLQAAPDGFKPEHALERGVAGIIGAVDRADAGADDEIGDDPVPRQ